MVLLLIGAFDIALDRAIMLGRDRDQSPIEMGLSSLALCRFVRVLATLRLNGRNMCTVIVAEDPTRLIETNLEILATRWRLHRPLHANLTRFGDLKHCGRLLRRKEHGSALLTTLPR